MLRFSFGLNWQRNIVNEHSSVTRHWKGNNKEWNQSNSSSSHFIIHNNQHHSSIKLNQQHKRFNSNELSKEESELLNQIREKYVSRQPDPKEAAVAKLEYFTQRKKSKQEEKPSMKVKEFIPKDYLPKKRTVEEKAREQKLEKTKKKDQKRLRMEEEKRKEEENRLMEEEKKRLEEEEQKRYENSPERLEKLKAAKERAISILKKKTIISIGKIATLLGRVDSRFLTEEDYNTILHSVIQTNSRQYTIQYAQEMISRGFFPSNEYIPKIIEYSSRNGEFEECFKFVKSMMREGTEIEEESFASLFSLIPYNSHDRRFEILNWALNNGIKLSGLTLHSFFQQLFEEFEGDIVGHEFALKYLKWMLDHKVEWIEDTAKLVVPNLYVLGSEGDKILKRAIAEGLADTAVLAYYSSLSDFRSITKWMKVVDRNRKDFLWMSIRYLEKSEHMNQLFDIYRQNQFKITPIEYEEAIFRFLEDKDVTKAHIWYSEMIRNGLTPTQFTFEVMIDAAYKMENYHLMESLRDDFIRLGVEPSSHMRRPLEEHYLI